MSRRQSLETRVAKLIRDTSLADVQRCVAMAAELAKEPAKKVTKARLVKPTEAAS